MGGGKIQLQAIGKENNYLTINPQISFFKSVYKKYSNFAMQSIKLDFESIDTLSFDKDTKLKLKLEKNADLINTMFFEVKLPTVINTDRYEFKWIDNLGAALIKSARIIIGGDVIEEYDSNYMYIYHNNFLTNEKKNMYDVLAGNKLKNEYNNISDNPNIPILTRDRLRIPLPFWFHRNIGLSLPIFALEYNDVILELVLRPIKELCMFKSVTSTITLVPALDINGLNINHDSIPNNSLTTIPDINLNDFFVNNRWDLEPSVDVNYIFIDKSDRELFGNSNLRYLVEPVSKTVLNDLSGEIVNHIQLYHQVKELYIVGQRNDVEKRNMWLNFTNFDDDYETNYLDYQNNFFRLSSLKSKSTTGTTALQYLGAFTSPDRLTTLKLSSLDWSTQLDINEDVIINSNDSYIKNENENDINNILDIWKYRPYEHIPYIGNESYKFYTENVIEELEIFFDQVERVSMRESRYYNLIQPYVSGLSNNAKQVLLYSFSLEPYNYQPSGKCNFNHIKELVLKMKIKDTSILPNDIYNYGYDNYKYNVYVYAKYYNILEIQSGMGQLLFRN